MPNRGPATLPFLACCVAGSLWSSFAQAQSDRAAGPELFRQGRALVSAGDYPNACPKFEESYRVSQGLGALFHLADCWEHLGRTASAWTAYLELAERSRLAAQFDREQVARDRAAALEPKLSRLAIEVSQPTQKLEITRDGTRVAAAQWGLAVPVDPGVHQVTAAAPGYVSWRQAVEVGNLEGTVTLKVPVLDREPAVEASPLVAPPVAPMAAPNRRTTVTARSASTPATTPAADSITRDFRVLGWVLGGLGVAGIAVGSVYGLRLADENDKADGICPTGSDCTDSEIRSYEAAISRAQDSQTLSILGFSLGGAAVGASGVMFWLSYESGAGGSGAAGHAASAGPALAFGASGEW